MTADRGHSVRLIASGGALVESYRSEASAGRDGTVDLTIQEIEVGHVVCTAQGAPDGSATDRTYIVLGEEALRLAGRSLLDPEDRAKVIRLSIEPPAPHPVGGPLEAVASAVRLGQRTTTANVVIRAGGAVIGRGGMVCSVRVGPTRAHETRPIHAV